MSKFKEILIIEFLTARNWILKRSGNLFNYFSPPPTLALPFDFELEIPKYFKDRPGFDNYMHQVINEISALLQYEVNHDDLNILFSREHSILKYRIFDAENKDGTISLQKHLESLAAFKRF